MLPSVGASVRSTATGASPANSRSACLFQPPAAELIKQAAGIEKGSGVPNRDKVATLTHAQVLDIAQKKMADLNANDVEMAARIIAGTARSMGVEVEA